MLLAMIEKNYVRDLGFEWKKLIHIKELYIYLISRKKYQDTLR